MQCWYLQDRYWQRGVHGLHYGVYDDRRYADRSDGAEPMQRVCSRVWWCELWRHKRLHSMHSGYELQSLGWQQRLHGVRFKRQLRLMHCNFFRHLRCRLYQR